MDAKFPGDFVYVLGETKNELGGSEYYQMMGAVGRNVPHVNAEKFWPSYLALHQAIIQGLVSSCHAVTRGGLAVHLAMVAMGAGLGIEIQEPMIPSAEGLSITQKLYSESCGRFIITVSPERKERFENLFDEINIGRVGVVKESPIFIIKDKKGASFIEEDLAHLKQAWNKLFGELV
jgi:phosphoribosylformylglycinamidine synthase